MKDLFLGNLSTAARIWTAGAPALVLLAYVLGGLVVYWIRNALRGPWRDKEAEAMLKGQPATADTFRKVAAKVVEGAKGYGSNTFKIELAKRAIVRALKQATEMDYTQNDNAFQNSNP